MKAFKWRKQLLAGILCAAMVFQNISVSAFARELETADVMNGETEFQEETDLSESADNLEETDTELVSVTSEISESLETTEESGEESFQGAEETMAPQDDVSLYAGTGGGSKRPIALSDWSVSIDNRNMSLGNEKNREAVLTVSSVVELEPEDVSGMAVTFEDLNNTGEILNAIDVLTVGGFSFLERDESSARYLYTAKVTAKKVGMVKIIIGIQDTQHDISVSVDSLAPTDWVLDISKKNLILNGTAEDVEEGDITVSDPTASNPSEATITVKTAVDLDEDPIHEEIQVFFRTMTDPYLNMTDSEVIDVSEFTRSGSPEQGAVYPYTYTAKVTAKAVGTARIVIKIGNTEKVAANLIVDSVMTDENWTCAVDRAKLTLGYDDADYAADRTTATITVTTAVDLKTKLKVDGDQPLISVAYQDSEETDLTKTETTSDILEVADFEYGDAVNGLYTHTAKVTAKSAGKVRVIIEIGGITKVLTIVVEKINSIDFDQHVIALEKVGDETVLYVRVVSADGKAWKGDTPITVRSTDPTKVRIGNTNVILRDDYDEESEDESADETGSASESTGDPAQDKSEGMTIQLIADGIGTSNIIASLEGEGEVFTDICKVTVGDPVPGEDPNDRDDDYYSNDDDVEEEDPLDQDANKRIVISVTKAQTTPVEYEDDANKHQVKVDLADITDESDSVFLIVKQLIEGGQQAKFTDSVKWSISDESVAILEPWAAAPGEKAVLRLKKAAGTAIITAEVEAKDGKEGYKAQLLLTVKDYTPILEYSGLTINKYSVNGTPIPIYRNNGNKITSVSITDERFQVKKILGQYVLTIKDEQKAGFTKKTSVKTKLNVQTEQGNNPEFDIVITVDVTLPKTTFKVKSKANVFYTNASTVIAVTSNAKITGIKNSVENVTQGFDVESYDVNTGLLTLRAVGLDSTTVNAFLARGSAFSEVNLDIVYEEYGTQRTKVAVSLQNQKPSYSIGEIYMLGNRDTTNPAQVINTKTKEVIEMNNNYKVSVLKPADVSVAINGSRLSVTYRTDKKSAAVTYQISLTNQTEWTSALTLKGKVSKGKAPMTELGMKSLTLNMAHNRVDNGTVSVTIAAKNNLSQLVRSYNFVGANKKSQELIDSGCLFCVFNETEQKINIGLEKGMKSSMKAGTYKFNVYGEVDYPGDDDITLGTTSLTIKLVDDAKNPPALKLSGKGSINLIDRANTEIIYTPKITNVTADIARISNVSGDTMYFEDPQLIDGKIHVKARENVQMDTKTTYKLGIELRLDNNSTVSASVSIKPVNKVSTIKADTTKETLYKSVGNIMSWKVSPGSFGAIDKINFVADEKKNKYGQYFILTDKGDGTVSIQLTSVARKTLKPGKYTVSYEVHMKDAAISSSPKVLKMTVTVK